VASLLVIRTASVAQTAARAVYSSEREPDGVLLELCRPQSAGGTATDGESHLAEHQAHGIHSSGSVTDPLPSLESVLNCPSGQLRRLTKGTRASGLPAASSRPKRKRLAGLQASVPLVLRRIELLPKLFLVNGEFTGTK
jgi:hypothetical protein